MNVETATSRVIELIMQNKRFVLAAVAVALVAWAGFSFFGNKSQTPGVYTVATTPLTQVVNFSGAIVPKTRTDLAFERTGRVARVAFNVGDTVTQGALVATLDAGSVHADISREQAVLLSEEATLAQLVRGTREEELALERARVLQTEQTLSEARASLIASIANGFTVTDTAIERFVDEMIDDPTTQPTLKHNTTKRSLELSIENERIQIEEVLNAWKADVAALSGDVSYENVQVGFALGTLLDTFRTSLTANAVGSLTETPTLIEYAGTARTRLNQMRDFLADISEYVGELTISPTLTQTTIDTWRTQAATERVNVSAAITALNSAAEKFTSAENALAVSRSKLDLLEAGATSEDIRAQQARVDAQEARIAALQSELSKFVLRAPQPGTLITKDIDQGELATAGSVVFVIDSTGALEIDARVSELDVIVLEEGMNADVTLDAYGLRENFPATITHIDPSESVVDGISGYGITVQFQTQDPRLRAGMTANAKVAVTLKEATTTIPVGYLLREGADTYVLLLDGNDTVRTPVTIGVQSDAGLIEIVEGLQEGDRIMLHDR